MVEIFDGKLKAKQIEDELVDDVKTLRKKGITPKLVSIMVGKSGGNKLYLNIKKKTAQRIGAELIIKSFDKSTGISALVHEIKVLNESPDVNGIMIQLPLPKKFSNKDREKVINAIVREKDVDGLRDDSPFTTPVVKAVLMAVKDATLLIQKQDTDETLKVVVVGAKGFEGRKIVHAFREMAYETTGLDIGSKDMKKTTRSADILVSVTGSPGIVGNDDIKEGTVVVDVGSPKGDIDFASVKDKASFITPVPGGIGPLTIACLMENLVESAR